MNVREHEGVAEHEKSMIDSLVGLLGNDGFGGLARSIRKAGDVPDLGDVNRIAAMVDAMRFPVEPQETIPSASIRWLYVKEGFEIPNPEKPRSKDKNKTKEEKEKEEKIPDKLYVDAYSISVKNQAGETLVWEWMQNDHQTIVKSMVKKQGQEDVVTEMTIKKGTTSIKQYPLERDVKVKPVEINTNARLLESIAMNIASIDEKFSLISERIDVINAYEEKKDTLVTKAANHLLENFFNQQMNGAHSGAFVGDDETKIEVSESSAPGVVVIAGVNYRMPVDEIHDMLPLSVASSEALNKGKNVSIVMPFPSLTKDSIGSITIQFDIHSPAVVMTTSQGETRWKRMPERVLPSISSAVATQVEFLSALLWEAEEVVLQGSSSADS